MSTRTCKDAQHHQLSEKGKVRSQQDATLPPTECLHVYNAQDWGQHYQGTGDGRGLLHSWLQGGKWVQSLWKIISIY